MPKLEKPLDPGAPLTFEIVDSAGQRHTIQMRLARERNRVIVDLPPSLQLVKKNYRIGLPPTRLGQ